MNLFDRVIERAERWIVAIDIERDRLVATVNWSLISEVERAFITERLAVLDRERIEAEEVLATLRTLEYRPEVMFKARPVRLLKVPLRREPEARKRA